MHTNKIIIKFAQADEQTEGPVLRVVGLVQAKHILGLFDAANLNANPRSAKSGAVTADIIDSITESPEVFPFKTKGVLVGASRYSPLQRRRYQLEFGDQNVEGILDGGHNMLAIGTYILSMAIDDEASIKKIKTWGDMKKKWEQHRDEIDAIKDNLDFLIPMEILFPSDVNDPEIVEEFGNSLLDICAARNNNVQLTLETKANKRGFYREIQNALPDEIAEIVEWKTNDGGTIKVRDIIALSWIPFNKLNDEGCLPLDISVPPQDVYNSKSGCSKQFDRLMEHRDVSKAPGNNYEHELHNSTVQSAIRILGQLPELYDKIYTDFPDAYNRGTGGKFGRNTIVKLYTGKYDKSKGHLGTQPRSKFTRQAVKYSYPDGMIMPLVYALSALMEINDGELGWKTNPVAFLDRCLEDIAGPYKLILDAFSFDPQKIGKNNASYGFAIGEFEKALSRYLA